MNDVNKIIYNNLDFNIKQVNYDPYVQFNVF